MSKPFPSPWRVEHIPGGFVVRDAERKPIAYVYGQENRRPFEEGSSSPLTMDEAREMAQSIARLPELRRNEAPGDVVSTRALVKWPNVPDLMPLRPLIPFRLTRPFRA